MIFQKKLKLFPFSSLKLHSNTEKNECSHDLPEWNLTDLYSGINDPNLSHDLQKASQFSQEFQSRWHNNLKKAALEENPEKLGKSIEEYEYIEALLGRILSFAELLYQSNTLNPDYVGFHTNISEKVTDISSHLLFFSLELNLLDDEVLSRALQKDDLLKNYEPWIRTLRQSKPYQLDEKLEKLFHEKEITSQYAWERLFDETIASMEFDIKGEKLRIEPALNKLRDKEPETRKHAASVLSEGFEKNLRTFTLITNTLAKNLDISNRWRSFKGVADFRHLSNNVEPNVIETLIESVRAAFPKTSHRYYRMKARWLKMERLNHWDRNAPLPNEPETQLTWNEAQNLVLSAYNHFCPEMAALGKRFFDHHWIDARIREGKAPGAFAHGTIPSVHPYLFMNYMGKPDDVMTLAHELGHGIHQILSGKQGILMATPPLTLSETASVFGEILTFRLLLDQTSNPYERKIILAQKIEDMLNTIVRQTAFHDFEMKLHNERQTGEIKSERIGQIWMETQQESLGDRITLHKGYETFWTFIPHFIHSPFYVYSYAFGNCLANTLYARYLDSKKGFVEKYLDMLKEGGKKHHKDLLAPFGLDASNPSFWKQGLSFIESLISELEALDTQEQDFHHP